LFSSSQSNSIPPATAEYCIATYIRSGFDDDGSAADTLSSYLDRPVKDKTHLDGAYSLSLEWEPAGTKPRGDDPSGPSIFAAIEEPLGLKLQHENEQLEPQVIDKARKTPTGN
jgi:uncharacterized protein (TIGR03435 family)